MPRKNKERAVLVRPRICIGTDLAIGPGKIDLLRAIEDSRSISAAARTLGMPYKRAWLLVETLNRGFGRPVVETATGGKGGGGARLTPLGRELVAAYTVLEQRLNAEAAAELHAFARLAH